MKVCQNQAFRLLKAGINLSNHTRNEDQVKKFTY
jgi:hypothetical protein